MELDFEGRSALEEKSAALKKKIGEGDWEAAVQLLEEAMAQEPENTDIDDNMRALLFWQGRREEKLSGIKEKGDAVLYAKTMLEYFDKFEEFLVDKGRKKAGVYHWIKGYIFSSLIKPLYEAYEKSKDDKTLLMLGRSLCETGRYEKALEAFDLLLDKMRYDSYLLSYIAETHNRLNNERLALAYLREALFYEPLRVPYGAVNIEALSALWRKTKEAGHEDEQMIKVWLSVVGELSGILSVKKRLNDKEAQNLKKTVSKLEAEYKKRGGDKLVEPRVLAAYLWLLNQLKIEGSAERDIDFVLDKLKKLNEDVYEQYQQTVKGE